MINALAFADGGVAVTELERVPPGVDPTVPSSARVYDYLLGGKDNLAVDRTFADRLLTVAPDARLTARANRDFLVRTVRTMAERGIRQFVDLGTGIPTSPSVHEIAHAADPSATVVYVDYDPVVRLHAEVLLSSGKNVTSVQADVRRPGDIVEDPEVTRLIDFSEPVGLIMVAVLHFVTDAEDPDGVVEEFARRVAPGSHLALSHVTSESSPAARAQLSSGTANTPMQVTFRPHERVRALFGPFELLDPGLVAVQDWRADDDGLPPLPGGGPPRIRVDGGLGRLAGPGSSGGAR
ncbi:SAM-dependent methyltransferase [Streptosporangium saharense]|uniref:SAM-dependent methyltransferase n=1 Tax=Streptosporangium saharense TaxID=1706840 RepID=A0A7W7QUK5_9ACTN|nr:SAM-dependent methyltransferase [Streptosporangium saharense]MBB4919864.1 SAM-dependent methyltransferase [Streptosporangium saharense]